MTIRLLAFNALLKHLLVLICLLLSWQPNNFVFAAMTGDSWCGTLMCVKATVNGSVVTYELKALNQLGWMSVGFGRQMKDTPLVILWPDGNNSITLSHRQASGHVQPTLVASPLRVARVSQRSNLLSAVSPTLAFDILKNNDTLQHLIWAFGVTRPPPDPRSTLEQHVDAGPFSLDLEKSIAATITSSRASQASVTIGSSIPIATPQPASQSPVSEWHRKYDSVLIAHSVVSFVGFAVFLPLSAIVARWGRTQTSVWLWVHWFISVVLSIPLIVTGWVLGPLSVSRRGRKHVANEHQIIGVVLFPLLILQLTLGAVLLRQHERSTIHPPRNVVHIVLGLIILILSFTEIKTGIIRYPQLTSSISDVLTGLWAAWITLISAVYLIGLTNLRRQRDQERLGWHIPTPPHLTTSDAINRIPSATGILTVSPQVSVDDDGTHDVYSPRRASSPDPDVTEMREVDWGHATPISVSLRLRVDT